MMYGRLFPFICSGLVAAIALALALHETTRADDDADPAAESAAEPAFRVLVYSRTLGFRHRSIPRGVAALRELGATHNFAVDPAGDPSPFTAESLDRYDAVIFLNTTGNVLSEAQREAFERYIRSGGGYVGIHAAADTGYDWPFYGDLVGAYFASHPHIQEATIIVEDRDHPSTTHLGETWTRTDEWYNFRASPRDTVRVLMRLDTSSFEGSTMGANHPIAWCHTIDDGRAWYTGGGHTGDSFDEPAFRQHLLGGITWAADHDLD